MRVIVEGYQSVVNADIDLPEGKIVGISGRNNTGKTAVVRAMSAFITNESGKRFIHKKIGKTRVQIQTSKGSYEWKKSGSSAVYIVNGRESKNINRASIDEVAPGSGFLVEREGGSVVIPSIVNENAVMFPFNLTPSIMFKIFSRFVVTPKLNDIIKEIKLLVKEDREKIIKIQGSVDQLEIQLSKKKEELKTLPPESVLNQFIKRLDDAALAKNKIDYIEKRRDDILCDMLLFQDSLKYVPDVKVMLSLRERADLLVGQIKELETLVGVRAVWVLLKTAIEKDKSSLSKYEQVIKQKEIVEKCVFYLIKIGEYSFFKETVKEGMHELNNSRSRILELKKEMLSFKVCPLCKKPLENANE